MDCKISVDWEYRFAKRWLAAYSWSGFSANVRISELLYDAYLAGLKEAKEILLAQQKSAPSASANTGSPKLPQCSSCDVPNELAYYRMHGYKFCPRYGRQLRASA
jgi:hypothetical protein